MSYKIWKYKLGQPGEEVIHEVPLVATVRHVGIDPQGVPCVWIEVDRDTLPTHWSFLLVATGQNIPDPYVSHLGSYVEGKFVWHLYASTADFVAAVEIGKSGRAQKEAGEALRGTLQDLAEGEA